MGVPPLNPTCGEARAETGRDDGKRAASCLLLCEALRESLLSYAGGNGPSHGTADEDPPAEEGAVGSSEV